jgi:hypothetical protein
VSNVVDMSGLFIHGTALEAPDRVLRSGRFTQGPGVAAAFSLPAHPSVDASDVERTAEALRAANASVHGGQP